MLTVNPDIHHRWFAPALYRFPSHEAAAGWCRTEAKVTVHGGDRNRWFSPRLGLEGQHASVVIYNPLNGAVSTVRIVVCWPVTS